MPRTRKHVQRKKDNAKGWKSGQSFCKINQIIRENKKTTRKAKTKKTSKNFYKIKS